MLLLDTFAEFQDYWQKFKAASIEEQIEGWRTRYMAPWPELLEKQVNDYESEGFDWRDIAKEQIFPTLGQRYGDMEVAHRLLLELMRPTISKATNLLEYDGDLIVVIYVGIGLGAGWATTYNERPAILLGLENIAECGWIDKESLSGLLAHEVGHLVHFGQREKAGLAKGSGPWWQLYSEGFAMRCEHLISGRESWHMREQEGTENWLEWCRSKRGWLAAQYLERVTSGESIRPFFGSWFDIEGYRQTGYFLGHEVVKLLEEELSLQDIALIADDDPRLYHALVSLTDEGS